MTADSFERSLRSFCNRRPFQPFFVELVTRERLLIIHPEAITLRGNLCVLVTPLAQYHLFDSTSICRVLDPGRD
jgi:hypothetical protein